MKPLAFQLFMNNWYNTRCEEDSGSFCHDNKFLCFWGREMQSRIRVHEVQGIVSHDMSFDSVCPDLMFFKSELKNTLFPENGKKPCTLMLVSNLAQPEWVGVTCDESLLFHVFCEEGLHSTKKPSVENLFNTFFCSTGSILTAKECHTFLWRSRDHISKEKFKRMRTNFTDNNIKFQFLFQAISSSFPRILGTAENSINTLMTSTPQYSRSIYNHSTPHVSAHKDPHQGNVTGFAIYEESRKLVSSKLFNNLFRCTKGSFISKVLVCDGKVDCLYDDTDEKKMVICKLRKCVSFNTPSSGFDDRTTKKHTQHDNVTVTSLNDHLKECQATREMVIFCPLVLGVEPVPCRHPSELACKEGFSLCYNISEICAYKLGVSDTLESCNNGGHLWNCRLFQCNKMFKCVYSYCIPWTYVCDYKWDCPRGDDEWDTNLCDSNEHCRNMYKCVNVKTTCTHKNNVCDGFVHCPNGDDEKYCDVLECPCQCQCLLYAAVCTSSQLSEGKTRYNIRSLTASFSVILNINNFVSSFKKLTHLHIAHCSAAGICGSSLPTYLVSLKVEFTKLRFLSKHCFYSYTFMKELHLPNDEISFVSSQALSHLPSLTLLNLSSNPLSDLPPDFITSLAPVRKIILLQVNLIYSNQKTFLKMNPGQRIETSDFHLCCLIPPAATCSAQIPWYISCSTLLPNQTIFFACLIMFSLLLLLNVVCFLSFLGPEDANKAFTVSVYAMSFANIFCGAYIATLWAADIFYKETFVLMEHMWRSSNTCHMAFGIILWFTLLSQSLLFFLPLSRLMVVLKPLNTKFKLKSFVIKCLWWQIILCLLVTVSVTSTTSMLQGNIPTNLCSPFIDPTHSSTFVLILTCAGVLFQLVTCTSTALFHFMLVCKVHETPLALPVQVGRPRHTFKLTLQLVILTLSHLVSWLPVTEDYLSAIFEARFSLEYTMWVTLICVPFNSVVFPSVLIVNSVTKLWSKKKQNDKLILEQKCT